MKGLLLKISYVVSSINRISVDIIDSPSTFAHPSQHILVGIVSYRLLVACRLLTTLFALLLCLMSLFDPPV